MGMDIFGEKFWGGVGIGGKDTKMSVQYPLPLFFPYSRVKVLFTHT